METPLVQQQTANRQVSKSCSRVAACAALVFVVLGCIATVQADIRAVVVAGLGGDPEYTQAFAEQARQIGKAFTTLSDDDQAVVVLHEPSAARFLDAISDAAAHESDLFALVMIGHGSSDSRGYRFNLPGKDPTTSDLVAALSEVRATRQMVLVGTSSSGAVLDALAEPGRVLVSATRSGAENNLVRFPRFFAEAFEGGAADYDRNEILTLAEAWRYTTTAVREYYESESLLMSENAELRGDGSQLIALARLGSLALVTGDPEVSRLLDQRLELETAFALLTARKGTMSRATYYDELETLLLKIARLQIVIDDATGWSESDAGS
jgi:hypothetical protein